MSKYSSSDTNSLCDQSLNRTDENDNTEPLDPRIQGELERLNKSCSDINKMENELEEAKSLFINLKNHQLQRLEYLQKKLGSCIVKSKPYYEALELTKNLQIETQKAVQEFQKANSLYKTAKETLSVAEDSLDKREIPDAWQDHLSSIITKINMSKKAADQAEEYHKFTATEYQTAEKKCQFLEKDLRRHISKSKLYYDEKFRWKIQMESQKMRIYELEKALGQTKIIYKEAMINLSKISEEIHNKRKLETMISEKEIESSPESHHEHLTDPLNSSQDTTNNNNNNNTSYQKYLDFYNLQLPKRTSLSNNGAEVVEIKSNDSLDEHFNSAEFNKSLEYFSLGMNSSGSNSSRCSSPSNSADSESLKENQSRHNLHLNQTEDKIEPINESISKPSQSQQLKKPTLTDNSGISSLRLATPKKEQKEITHSQSIPKSMSLKFNSPRMNNNETLAKKNTKNNQETPLLNNLLLHSKY